MAMDRSDRLALPVSAAGGSVMQRLKMLSAPQLAVLGGLVLGLGIVVALEARGPAPASALTVEQPEPAARPALPAMPSLAAAAPAARRVRGAGVVMEHDDVSLAGTVRHLLRATVPAGLPAEELRRTIDRLIDEERLNHPNVDSAAVYLYEEQVYARFVGRATPLGAAVAHGDWAPGGEWTSPARSVSGLDNRSSYVLPKTR